MSINTIGETRRYETDAARIYMPSTDQLINKTELVRHLVGGGFLTKIRLGWELRKLKKLYHKFVDEYGYPKEKYRSELSKPIDELMIDHGIKALGPLIQLRLKSQGYDRGGMSAYSALFFLDPKFLRAKDGILQMGFSIGFQDLWEKLDMT